jgi:hypothetical protein
MSIFIPKFQIWVYFRGPWNGKCWYVLWLFGIFCGHLVYFVAIWYILWPFGIVCFHLVILSPFWYVVERKIWQPWVTERWRVSTWVRLEVGIIVRSRWFRQYQFRALFNISAYVKIYHPENKRSRPRRFSDKGTRLDEFSPIRWLFILCSFLKISQVCSVHFRATL